MNISCQLKKIKKTQNFISKSEETNYDWSVDPALLDGHQKGAFPHDAEDPLVVYARPIYLQLVGYAPVAISGELQGNRFYPVLKVGVGFNLLPVFRPVVIGAAGNLQHLAPPFDAAAVSGGKTGNKLSLFRVCSIVAEMAFFKKSLSMVNLPTMHSSSLMRSL